MTKPASSPPGEASSSASGQATERCPATPDGSAGGLPTMASSFSRRSGVRAVGW